MARDISTPLAALEYAMDVIASFRYDIRNSKDAIGLDLEGRGFCGGAFYRNAELGLSAALLRFQQEADSAAEEAPGTAPRTVPEPPPEGTVARAAWDSGQRLWTALRLYITRPSDLDYNWHKEWPALPSALRGQLAYAADDVPAPEHGAMPEPSPEPANPYPFRDGSEQFLARTQLTNALTEVRRLEHLIARLDNPLLLGYAGVAVTTLEHLSKMLETSPNPYPLDPEIIADGP